MVHHRRQTSVSVVVGDDLKAGGFESIHEIRGPQYPLLTNPHMEQERLSVPLDMVGELYTIGHGLLTGLL